MKQQHNDTTILFRRIKPVQWFNIDRYYIAQLVKISLSAITIIELWANILSVHRRDKAEQFVSYR